MTHSPEYQPQDPEIVFNTEYWGDTTNSFSFERFRWVPRAERTIASSLVARLALKAIDGSLQGSQVVPGAVFDPADDQIAMNSPHNFPGTVLLYDIEALVPYHERTAKAIEERTVEKDSSDRSNFKLSPRSLMRVCMENTEDGMIAFGAGRTSYSNGDMIYRRKANIAYIAHARKGTRQLLELSYGAIYPHIASNRSSDSGVNVHLMPSMVFHGGVIGETQVTYANNNEEFVYAYRIKSLEILAGGQPAVAPQKRTLSSLLPSAAK